MVRQAPRDGKRRFATTPASILNNEARLYFAFQVYAATLQLRADDLFVLSRRRACCVYDFYYRSPVS